MVLVAVLTGTVIVGFTGADTEQRLRGSAQQLAYSIELARQNALQRNREWGLHVASDGVRFAEFDPQEQAWQEQTQRPFAADRLPDGVTLRLESEEFEAFTETARENLPDVMLLSNGEVTPFTLHLEPDGDATPWQVHSDGIAAVTAEQQDR